MVCCGLVIGKVPRYFHLNVRLVGHFLADSVLGLTALVPFRCSKRPGLGFSYPVRCEMHLRSALLCGVLATCSPVPAAAFGQTLLQPCGVPCGIRNPVSRAMRAHDGQMSRRSAAAAGILLPLLFTPQSASAATSTKAPAWARRSGSFTDEELEGFKESSSSGLQFKDIREGVGAAPQPGDVVYVHYAGDTPDICSFYLYLSAFIWLYFDAAEYLVQFECSTSNLLDAAYRLLARIRRPL